MTKAIATWIGCLVLAAGTAAAAPGSGEAPRLTLAEAARAALEGFPAVEAARAEEQAAQAALDEAEAARRPSLSLGAGATRYQKPSLVTPIHGLDFQRLPAFDRTLFRGQVEAGYSLYEGGGREARIRRQAAEAAAAAASLSAAEQATVARVAASYLEALRLAESLAADQARIAALEAEVARVEQLLEVGRAAEVERLRAAAALAAARAGAASRGSRLDSAERELARLVGADPAATRAGRLAPVAPPAEALPERQTLGRAAVDASPQVEEARRRLAAAEASVALAASGRLPRLALVAQELGFGGSQGSVTGEWNAGVQLAVPLYTGGATGLRVAQAEAVRRAAAAGVRLAEMDVDRQLDEALARFTEAAARRRSLAAAVASFAEVVRVEELRLEAEVGVQTDFLEAVAQLQSSRSDLAEARYQEIGARVELARVVGRLAPEWLAASLGSTEAVAGEGTP